MLARAFLCLTALGLLIGCGGGGGTDAQGVTNGTAGEQVSSFGELEYVGRLPTAPLVAGGTNVSVVGLVGSISRAVIKDTTPTLDETQVAITTSSALVLMDASGTNAREITNGTDPGMAAGYSLNGGTLYYSRGSGIFAYNLNTGITTQIISSPFAIYGAQVSPDGTRIVYQRSPSGSSIWVADINGSNNRQWVTNTSGTTDSFPCWITNSRINFMRGTSLYTIDLTETTPTLSAIMAGANLVGSHNGRMLAQSVYNSSLGQMQILLVNVRETGYTSNTRTLTVGGSILCFAADNQHILVGKSSGGTSIVDLQGNEVGTLELPNITQSNRAEWQPFPPDRLVVGTGASFASAAGMIFSQQGQSINSYAIFDATTRSTATLTRELDGEIGPNVVFRAEADRITKLSFTPDRSYRLVSGLGTGTINGALVSFDSETGAVSSVVSYNVTRSSGRPTVRREGDRIVIEGSLVEAFGRDGKKIDVSSGRVVVEASATL